MKLPKNAILTNTTALYIYNFISYNPSKKIISMKWGTNTSWKGYENFIIETQYEDTLNVGAKKIDLENNNKVKIYSKERLFIELDKFHLENTIFNEAHKNLLKEIKPNVVFKLFEKLKTKRKGLKNNKRVKKYLEEKYFNINELIFSKPEITSDILREYIISLLSEKNIPILLKGGSAIELFVDFKRSTIDIDALIAKNEEINNILNLLSDKNNEIYFKEESKKVFKKSGIISYCFKPFTHKKKIKNIIAKTQLIKISFNFSIGKKEINKIIFEFKLTKRKLKILKNYSSFLLFSREMLIAEKFQSIISKPENTIRTKDLFDLYFLCTKDIDFSKVKKWYLRKFEIIRNSKNNKEAIQIIEDNLDKELIKIKDNFISTSKMFGEKIEYEEAIKKYKKIGNAILKN